MRPEELLRRYLEQRREMGESDLVLDTMSVEDVLRLLGARAAATGGAAAAVPAPADLPTAPPPPRQRELPADAPTDWRAALRADSAGATVASDAGAATPARSDDMPRKRTDDQGKAPPAGTGAAGAAPQGIVVGESGTGLFGGPLSQVDSIAGIAEMVAKCTRCPLYATALNPVPGEGSPTAQLMCVGEAPGATEDETGRPFVGAAGQLLTKILAAIDLRREDVFIANVLKHRPPGNRNPRPEEVDACRPYLVRQVELIQPKVIIAFGTFAAQTLLETKLAIGKLRGQVHRYHGIPLVVTYHPAALLRNPAWKRPTWEDVQLARRILDSALA
ncbi:MAG TPA: uracil-DNA glycosylase [Gemmatimonadaceae bacterium]|nr:uracil-DNA glycosylase [Gemmatimonadaceae bacterium]